jgi:hypothetical protein
MTSTLGVQFTPGRNTRGALTVTTLRAGRTTTVVGSTRLIGYPLRTTSLVRTIGRRATTRAGRTTTRRRCPAIDSKGTRGASARAKLNRHKVSIFIVISFSKYFVGVLRINVTAGEICRSAHEQRKPPNLGKAASDPLLFPGSEGLLPQPTEKSFARSSRLQSQIGPLSDT